MCHLRSGLSATVIKDYREGATRMQWQHAASQRTDTIDWLLSAGVDCQLLILSDVSVTNTTKCASAITGGDGCY